MNRYRAEQCLLAFFILALLTPILLEAQPSTTEWSVAVLDQILAATPSGQKTAQVDDMDIPVGALSVWRNRLAGARQPKSATRQGVQLWPNGIVPYTFSNNVSIAKQRAFLDAAGEWSLFSDTQFIPRTSEANYVTVYEDPSLTSGGRSAVGMIGGQQILRISGQTWNRYVACHEIGHCLGLIHEHQRSDRDSFVSVIATNIAPLFGGSWVKLTDSQNHGPYDFLSVMHYWRNAQSLDPSKDTMVPRPNYSQFINIMGRQHDPMLSVEDRAGVAQMYGPGPLLSPIVTNTSDSLPGSLRAALYYAYDHPGTTITFNIPGSDSGFSNNVFNILPTDALPSLVNGTTIDGNTQPGVAGSNGPKILVGGSFCQPPSVYANGFKLIGQDCVIRSLIVSGFPLSGILLDGTNSMRNKVVGCAIGLAGSGIQAFSNTRAGVDFANGARNNIVGGSTVAERNVISGNGLQGVRVRDSGTSGNTIRGNFIGVNATGTAPVPNLRDGVAVYDGASFNVIADNILSGNQRRGILLLDSGTLSNRITGNYIGLDATGNQGVSNWWCGLELTTGANGNVVGGSSIGARNVISGNGLQGVCINGGSGHNVIQGNFIGVNASGTAPVPNLRDGVAVYDGASFNVIADNILSGNERRGVLLLDSGTLSNRVTGNHVGLDATGDQALSNGWAGVEVSSGAQGTVIGGSGPEPNVISGNGTYGVLIGGTNTFGTQVRGNSIGQNATGATFIPNARAGVYLYGGTHSNIIGGIALSERNTIAGNLSDGVQIAQIATTNNTVRGNSFFGNAGTGIALYSGGNLNARTPALTSASSTTNVTVSGNLTAVPDTVFQIDFYGSPNAPTQGRDYLVTKTVTTGAGSLVSFSAVMPDPIDTGTIITATATDSWGNTSGMSSGVTVPEPVFPPSIAVQPQGQTMTAGTTVSLTTSATGTPPLAFQWLKDGRPLTGQTASALSFVPVTLSDSGIYSVLVSNAYGVATSSPAQLTVKPLAYGLSWTPSSAVPYGTSLASQLNATASVAGDFSYTPSAGTILPAGFHSLRADFSPANAGIHTPASTNVPLTVHRKTLTITANNAIRYAEETNPVFTARFAGFITGEGTNNLTSQPVLTTPATPASPPGTYPITVTGGIAENYAISRIAGTLTILNNAPEITLQPSDWLGDAGSSAPFSVGANGATPLFIHWRKDGVPIPGATNTTFVVSGVSIADVAGYDARITNAFGAATSSIARLDLNGPPVIIAEPPDLAVAPGGSLTIRVRHTGSPPFTYRWFKGVQTVSTAGPELVINGATVADAGLYQLSINNSLGFVGTRQIRVSVVAPPSLSFSQSAYRTRHGDSLTLQPQVSGAEPRVYRWFHDGSVLIGATNPTLLLTNLVRTNAGIYRTELSNAAGVATDDVILHVAVPQRMRAPEMLPDGRMRFVLRPLDDAQLNQTALSNLIIEASPDLTNWHILSSNGVSLLLINGNASFEDNDATNHSNRFYRAMER